MLIKATPNNETAETRALAAITLLPQPFFAGCSGSGCGSTSGSGSTGVTSVQ